MQPISEASINLFTGKNRFLSNFAAFPVVFEGVEYPTAEHAYVAAKTLDPQIRDWVRQIDTPGNAKYRGKSIALRPDWEDVRNDIMLVILRSKFTRNQQASDQLIATGDAELVEGNAWHDNYWGRCRCKACAGVVEAHNVLGRLLMAVRDELRRATSATDA
jgi:N-glycosidase YbiA